MWPNTKYLFNGRISTQYEQTAENHLNPIDIILTKNHPLLFTESFIAACGLTSHVTDHVTSDFSDCAKIH